MIRIAAAGDTHLGLDAAGSLRPHLEELSASADVLLLAGDLTRVGDPAEAKVVAAELADVEIPRVAVLGNHDHHVGEAEGVVTALEDAGIVVLDGESVVLDIRGVRVGIVGTKGFGGGFAGASGTEFGEPEMKAFIAHTREVATRLQTELERLDTDVRIALLHYSPVKDTLQGERLEIYPFLGSYLLGQAIDEGGADLVVHGHAHGGTEKGVTPGGTHVRNVALPVIQRSYRIYQVEPTFPSPARGESS
jgi:Icc-related predicted phosphoesterase